MVNSLQYNAANQVKAINYYDATETRAYNSLMQLTNITTNDVYLPSSKINITYNYTAGSNNGKIGSATDSLSGETVTYQYDSLNRLISASGSGWTQTQAYDGFGNLTSRTGTGTAQSTTISTPTNATTNRLSGYTYDANGNLISTGYTYDVENRISFANAGGVQYFYDAQNKRVWQASCHSRLLHPRRHLVSEHGHGEPVRHRRQAARQLRAAAGLEQQHDEPGGDQVFAVGRAVVLRREAGRPAVGDQHLRAGDSGPAGLGGQVLSLWRGAQLPAVAQRPGEVRNVHAGFGDRE